MKSPSLYGVIKIELKELIESNFHLKKNDLSEYIVKQQYNQLFRHIKRVKKIYNNMIEDVVFLDCKTYKNYEVELKHILESGFMINNTKYKFYGKSASMGRAGVIGFISDSMHDYIDEVAMMGLDVKETVLSKFEAYKHLLFSSCFCVEEKLPYTIVVDDYEKIISNVHIKYVDEVEKDYIDKETQRKKVFREKVIKEGHKDININTNDGAGLCSMEQAEKWSKYLELDNVPCAFMLRIPYVKGIAVAFDFKNFLKERNVFKIKDLWGKYHDVDKVDVILTKSQYKGLKYFKQDGTYNDWLDYLRRVKKYNHCLGISKWNFSYEEEPKMQRINYQILQTLDITDEDIWDMSEYTRNWIEKILKGDLLYTYNYLGLNGDKIKPSNNYMRAILLNPIMLNDKKVKKYLYGIIEKTIDELKIGKMYVKGCFKILIPDLIMLTEHIGGLTPKGCLKEGEMFSKNHLGEYILNRNPHICSSEHVILDAVNNDYIYKWLGHIEGCCMINGYDVTAPRLNGADMDGDITLVHNTSTFFKGIKRDLPIVMDIEDKITAIEKLYNLKNLIEFTLMSLDSRIGEISNCASSYHNKNANSLESKRRYEDYTCLLSVINGKEIDRSKTGVRWNVPRHISKYAKPLPYFLKYKYDNLNKTSNVHSPLNKFCWKVEKWQKQLKFDIVTFLNTSDYIIDKNIYWDDEKYSQVKFIFNEYKKEYREIKKQEKMIKQEVQDNISCGLCEGISKDILKNTSVNWDKVYNKYRERLGRVISNQSELANYVVELSYNNNGGEYYLFAWMVAEEGIISNLRANLKEDIYVPIEIYNKENGIEYLGKYYKLNRYNKAM